MAELLLVSTRKGLFALERSASGWTVGQLSFKGENCTLAVVDPRDGDWYVAMNLGHFGVKLKHSPDRGQTWADLPVPAYPEGETIPSGDGKEPKPATLKLIWALEGPGLRASRVDCGPAPHLAASSIPMIAGNPGS